MIKKSCSYHFSCKLFVVQNQFQLKSLSNYSSFFLLLSCVCVCVCVWHLSGWLILRNSQQVLKKKYNMGVDGVEIHLCVIKNYYKAIINNDMVLIHIETLNKGIILGHIYGHSIYLFIYLFIFKFLLLFNYSCMPFLPIPPPHPSWTHLPPPPPPSPLILSMCPL